MVEGAHNVTAFAPAVVGEDFMANNRETKFVQVRRAHDLVVYLECPTALELGNLTNLKVNVLNNGVFAETNVTVSLIINGSVMETLVFPWLMNGMTSELQYDWFPAVEGIYNVTGYAPPIAGEELVWNNVQSVNVTVYPGVVPTLLSVYPSNITVMPNSIFNVNITVSNVENFYGFEFKLFWNTTVLDLVKVNLHLPWSTSFLAKNETLEEIGRYWVGAAGLGPAAPFYGSTNLVTLSFKSTMLGSSKLDLSDTKLGTSSAIPILHAVLDGFVVIAEAPVSKPGDLNGDGFVDMYDIIIVAAAFASQIGGPGWDPRADTNDDGLIDIFDLVFIAIHFWT